MLRVDDLHAGYGGGTVLHGVTLQVAAGEVYAVVGANGAGKTTLVHAIAGLRRPTRGRIHFEGKDLTGLPAHRRTRAGIGLVPQGRRIFPGLTVAEHLSLVRRPSAANGRSGAEPAVTRPESGGTSTDRSATWDHRRILDLLPQLAARLRHRGGQLSGGEQQMLAIARALLTQPRLLLLDEPTEGLAPGLAIQIRDLITSLAGDHLAILLAAPHPDLALAVADRVSVLTAGKLASPTTVSEEV